MTASIMLNNQLWTWDGANHRFYTKRHDGAEGFAYRSMDDFKRVIW